MKPQILQAISDFALRQNVQVLLAVEVGSRCWGYYSADSDYDIRIIFARPQNDYLSVREKEDCYTWSDGLLDIQAWDIKKALSLATKSNVSFSEWIRAPRYVEKERFCNQLHEVEKRFFNPRKTVAAYCGWAHNMYKAYFNKPVTEIKRYIYAMRPLLACEAIMGTMRFPALALGPLVENWCPPDLQGTMRTLISRKRTGKELETIPRYYDPALNDWILAALDKHSGGQDMPVMQSGRQAGGVRPRD